MLKQRVAAVPAFSTGIAELQSQKNRTEETNCVFIVYRIPCAAILWQWGRCF